MKFLGLMIGVFLSLDAFSKPVSRKSDDNITSLIAEQRKSQVQEVNYNLHFELFKGKNEFNGLVEINTVIKDLRLPLSIDSVEIKIKTVKINGQEIKGYPIRRGSFDIPIKYLAREMKIEISYEGQYSKESGGFLKSVDPEDSSEYVYTDFEPYHAHKLFPCFDQPDLKATYTLKVKAPSDWKVIGNELVDSKTEVGANTTLTTFKTTQKFSTYLFFMGAGPFEEWTDNAGKIPLFLYARKSLAKYVDYKEIFGTTKKGMKFFNEYFDYAYPFSKYGQIFIPEFAWGGMENPGAVTINEKNIFRGPVTRSTIEDRDNLILHEMAHMWFGDLVTMQWWNDLWLNESFATYLATIAQEKALDSKATWMDFFYTKTWGYWQDQLITTHPIETEVPDIRTARGNFDGITYAKGAAALKQLHFFVGEEGFRQGIRAYFKKHAFQNTVRRDFIGSIAEASKKDLEKWTQKWLQTAGPNFVSVNFSCKDGRLNDVFVEQKESVSKNLSPHRTRLALYKIDDRKLHLIETVDVTYTESKTVVSSLIGKECPDFLLPNYEDQDYAIFSLDKISMQNAGLALTTISDPLSKMMVWSVLSQMVRDAKLDPTEYFKLVFSGLEKEEDDLLLGNLLGRHSSIRNQYFLYLSEGQRNDLAPSFEELLIKRFSTADPGSSLQMAFFDFYVSIAQTKNAQDYLYTMLVKNSPPKGIILDQDRRWSIISNLAINGHPESLKLSQEEVKKDSSTLGLRTAFAVKASFPNIKSKQQAWKEMLTKKLTYSNFGMAAARFHGPNQSKLSKHFVDPFFKKVKSIDWKSNDSIVDIYFESLFPMKLCSNEVLVKSQRELKTARNLTSIAKRSWMEAHDELSRCVKVTGKLKN